MSDVRVRFAPSPTGYLHVGNARTAILNWLFARHSGGKMILRIEDTDFERSTREYEKALMEDLHWLGLDWDEGPDVGGEYGPYRQSERLEIYKEYALNLLEEGHAFHCYCTVEEVKERAQAALQRGETPHYDGHCRRLSEEEVSRYQEEGRKPVIRFHVPGGKIQFSDLVHGEVEFEGTNVSDFVILRSDGIATYNFAVVVDDALMRISHVIRGEDHLSNTPKQVLLFRALGFEVPIFVHVPMILGEDRTKLSKRHGDNSVRDYREKGYLPEALVNFLSLLGWSSPSGDEILSIDRLIREFDFDRLSKSAAIFNPDKLNWMNGWYIRHTDLDRIVELGIPFLQKAGFDVSDREYVKRCIAAVIDGVEYLAQLPDKCKIFFRDEVEYENLELIKSEKSKRVFECFLRETENVEEWNGETFRAVMKKIQKETGIKGKELWMPIRVALTGQEHGPELPTVVELLGKEKCRRFVEKAYQM